MWIEKGKKMWKKKTSSTKKGQFLNLRCFTSLRGHKPLFIIIRFIHVEHDAKIKLKFC